MKRIFLLLTVILTLSISHARVKSSDHDLVSNQANKVIKALTSEIDQNEKIIRNLANNVKRIITKIEALNQSSENANPKPHGYKNIERKIDNLKDDISSVRSMLLNLKDLKKFIKTVLKQDISIGSNSNNHNSNRKLTKLVKQGFARSRDEFATLKSELEAVKRIVTQFNHKLNASEITQSKYRLILKLKELRFRDKQLNYLDKILTEIDITVIDALRIKKILNLRFDDKEITLLEKLFPAILDKENIDVYIDTFSGFTKDKLTKKYIDYLYGE